MKVFFVVIAASAFLLTTGVDGLGQSSDGDGSLPTIVSESTAVGVPIAYVKANGDDIPVYPRRMGTGLQDSSPFVYPSPISISTPARRLQFDPETKLLPLLITFQSLDELQLSLIRKQLGRIYEVEEGKSSDIQVVPQPRNALRATLMCPDLPPYELDLGGIDPAGNSLIANPRVKDAAYAAALSQTSSDAAPVTLVVTVQHEYARDVSGLRLRVSESEFISNEALERILGEESDKSLVSRDVFQNIESEINHRRLIEAKFGENIDQMIDLATRVFESLPKPNEQ